MPADAPRAAVPLAVRLLPPLAVALVTLTVFAGALGHGFVAFDDDRNLLDNPHFRGFGWTHLRWMFTSAIMGHWTPVTWLTLAADHALWGMDARGYHLTSVLLHAANAALVLLLARRLLGGGTGALVGAAAAALAWALHPLRVESVAWVTERRDVLSAFWALLAVLAYLTMAQRAGAARRRWLGVSLLLYALGLLSKSMLISLPFVLLVLDVYPLRRLSPDPRRWREPAAAGVLREKLPYLAMAAAVAAMLALTMSAMVRVTALDLPARIALAAYGLVFQVRAMLVPVGLSPMYELPAEVSLLAWPFLISAVVVAVAAVALTAARHRWPAGLAAAMIYALAMAPVSGFVHAGPQLVADRFGYLPLLPFALLLGGGVRALLRSQTALRGVAVLGLAAWVAGLAWLTWSQVQVWRDTDTLLRHTLQARPDCAWCHNQWGAVLGNRGDFGAAAEHFRRALALRPDRPAYRANLGLALLNAGRPAEAVPHLEAMATALPGSVEAQTRLGLALIDAGHTARALPPLQRAVALAPTAPLPRYGLARAHLALGDRARADEQLGVLRALDPRMAEAVGTR